MMLDTPEAMEDTEDEVLDELLEEVRLEKSRLVRLERALVTEEEELEETSPADPATRPRENCL